MFKFRFFSLVVISMMLIFGLSASSVLAKPGGVKVDDDKDCTDPDREENFNPDIDSGVTIDEDLCEANLWVNLSTNHFCGGPLDFEISCNDGTFVSTADCELNALIECTGKYAAWDVWDFRVPSTTAGEIVICTITVIDTNCPADNQVIGKDSWRQDDSC